MSLDNSAQILTTHDLGNLRILQQHHHPQQLHHQQHNLTTGVTTNVATTTSKALFGGNLKNLNSNSNMILSTIPLDGRALIIPTIANGTQQTQQQQSISNSQQQQQQRFTVTSGTSTNGFRSLNAATTLATVTGTTTTSAAASNNLSNLLAAAGVTTKTTILNTQNNSNTINTNNSSNHNNTNNTMPTTSKYLLVQQNSNGQYTTYEGSATTATPTGNGGTNVGNIVLLATEPLTTGNGNEQQQHVITTTTSTTTGNDNDEELRPLAWLSDSNLIKGIVTTNGSNGNIVTTVGGNNAKRQGNICIVNASNAHDLIEELPPHVASEENVIATTAHSTDASSKAQITTLSVSDFQQQFITSNKRFTPITVSSNSITNSSNSGNTNQLNTLANFTLAQDANLNTATTRDGTQHIYSNIAALGATTSVHVGPSGTTTVVEYKTTNGNFLPTQRQLINGSSVVVSAANNNNNNAAMNTTITATNLSNNHNNNNNTNVPSSSSSMSGATSTIQKTLMTLPNATTLLTTNTTNGNQQTVVNSNSTTNTVYHAQKQQQISNNHNNNNNNMNMNTNTSTTVSTTTTTHHPHKKYLREKMNVLDHGGGGGNASSSNTNTNTNNNAGVALALVVSSAPTVLTTQNTVPSSAITVVASPASSLSSQSSSSTSSSTAAVNGGNSPISKSFFALGNGNGTTAIAVNYASNSSNSPSPSSSAPLTTIGSLPASYTIVSQASQQNVGSSPVIVSSPESQSTKDYYTLTSVPQSNNNTANNQQRYYHQSPNNQNQHSHSHNQQQYHQHQHQQQQQQHNHQHNSMRSPISHSSYDNDSLKDFDISPNDSTTNSMGARLSATSTPQHQNNVSYHTCTSKSGSSHAAGQGNNTPQKQKHPNNVPYDPLVHTHNKPPYSFSSLIFMAIESSQEKALPVKEIYAWIVQHFPYFKTAPTGWKNSVRHNLSLNKSFVKVEKAPNMGKGSLWRVEQQQRQNLIQSLTRSPFFPNSAVDKIALKSGNTNNSGNNMQLNNNTNYDVIDGAMSPPSQASPTPQSTPNSKTHMNSRFDPQLFPNLSKTFKDMSDASSALSDVPDDEYPSDYSTTNHNNINMNNNAGNNNIHNETQKNSNNKNKYNNYGGGSDVVDSGANSNCNGSTTMMGAFSNYESIERLARDCGAENIDDVNAATAMLALKHGPKVFAETFQNGAPVITSSPSEDHTYSAGNNSAATSGASTPLINGNSSGNLVVLNGNGSATTNGNKQNGSDNQSNCASSDAAYESSEESHNISPEELEDQKRYRDGVDALLSLSLSSVVDSTSGSPVKRPASTSVEEEHLAASLESNSNMSNSSPPQHNLGKMSILTNSTTFPSRHHHQQQQQQYNNNNSNNNSNGNGNGINILDEGYNTQSYYGINNTNSSHHHHYNTQQNHLTLLTTPSSSKKVKPLRSLRTKIKRKAPWMR